MFRSLPPSVTPRLAKRESDGGGLPRATCGEVCVGVGLFLISLFYPCVSLRFLGQVVSAIGPAPRGAQLILLVNAGAISPCLTKNRFAPLCALVGSIARPSLKMRLG